MRCLPSQLLVGLVRQHGVVREVLLRHDVALQPEGDVLRGRLSMVLNMRSRPTDQILTVDLVFL